MNGRIKHVVPTPHKGEEEECHNKLTTWPLIYVSDTNLPVSHDQNVMPHSNLPIKSLEPHVSDANDVPVVASTSKDCYVPVTEGTHVTAAHSKRSGELKHIFLIKM